MILLYSAQVFNTSQSNSTAVAKLCGNTRPNPIFLPQNSARLVFVTDNSQTHRGFGIAYTASAEGPFLLLFVYLSIHMYICPLKCPAIYLSTCHPSIHPFTFIQSSIQSSIHSFVTIYLNACRCVHDTRVCLSICQSVSPPLCHQVFDSSLFNLDLWPVCSFRVRRCPDQSNWRLHESRISAQHRLCFYLSMVNRAPVDTPHNAHRHHSGFTRRHSGRRLHQQPRYDLRWGNNDGASGQLLHCGTFIGWLLSCL